MRNYFAQETVAARYAAARPDFYPLVIRKIAAALALDRPLRRALDVACGTGLSTRPLRDLARSVVGVDVSSGMLRQAVQQPRPGLSYVRSPAEQLPFAAQSFALVTASLAFHWFDRARFLPEVARLLVSGGWLVIYNNVFTGRMEENPDFLKWMQQVYLTRYPSPPRHRQPLTEKEAAGYGFHFDRWEPYENVTPFAQEELARYLLTQSNTVAAIEYGSETVGEVLGWLQGELAALFPVSVAAGHFTFAGEIWYLQQA